MKVDDATLDAMCKAQEDYYGFDNWDELGADLRARRIESMRAALAVLPEVEAEQAEACDLLFRANEQLTWERERYELLTHDWQGRKADCDVLRAELAGLRTHVQLAESSEAALRAELEKTRAERPEPVVIDEALAERIASDYIARCQQIADLESQLAAVTKERDRLAAEKREDAWHRGWQEAVRERDEALAKLAALEARIGREVEMAVNEQLAARPEPVHRYEPAQVKGQLATIADLRRDLDTARRDAKGARVDLDKTRAELEACKRGHGSTHGAYESAYQEPPPASLTARVERLEKLTGFGPLKGV